MKKLQFALLLCLSATLSFAQDVHFKSGREKSSNKPQLFAKEPARISVKADFFNKVLSFKVDQRVTVAVASTVSFSGKVTAITHDAPGLETIIMQSTETPGLVLSLSKVNIPGEGIQYRGIMMSKGHSDMLMLEKDMVTGNYVWNKKSVAHMIPD
jgi:hypothetical protein